MDKFIDKQLKRWGSARRPGYRYVVAQRNNQGPGDFEIWEYPENPAATTSSPQDEENETPAPLPVDVEPSSETKAENFQTKEKRKKILQKSNALRSLSPSNPHRDRQHAAFTFTLNVLRRLKAEVVIGAKSPTMVVSPSVLQTAIGSCIIGSYGSTRGDLLNAIIPNAGSMTDVEESLKALCSDRTRYERATRIVGRLVSSPVHSEHSGHIRRVQSTYFKTFSSSPLLVLENKAERTMMDEEYRLALKRRMPFFKNMSWVQAKTSSIAIATAAVFKCRWSCGFQERSSNLSASFNNHDGTKTSVTTGHSSMSLIRKSIENSRYVDVSSFVFFV